MLRLKMVSMVALLVAVVVFCGYSIPVYLHLLARQPGRDALDPTSFPPTYAFFIGAYYAALTFIATCSALLLIRLVHVIRVCRKR